MRKHDFMTKVGGKREANKNGEIKREGIKRRNRGENERLEKKKLTLGIIHELHADIDEHMYICAYHSVIYNRFLFVHVLINTLVYAD